jgi:WD40 repeat protein
MILAGANGPQVKLWRLSTGSEQFVTDEHEQPVLAVAACPDGKLMASAGGDNTIRLFDTNGKELAILKGHDKPIFGIAFISGMTGEPNTKGTGESKSQPSRTYTRLASVSEDHTVKIWDLEKHTVLATLRGHDNTVYCVAPSPDASIIATGSADATVRLWDTALDREAVVLQGRRAGSIISLAFSPDSKLLAAAEFGKSRCIRVWDIETSREVALIPGVDDDFRTVLFTPDGKRLIGFVYDGTVRLWQVDKVIGPEKD